jgi:hypothetical protein
MGTHIIVANADNVLARVEKLNQQYLDGNLQGIRKKPPVIAVALNQSIQLNCWCITLMEIYIIQN